MKIYLSSKGISPEKDNSPIINRQIETAKEGSTLVWKDGRFPLGSTIVQNKRLHWEGAEDTTLAMVVEATAARFTRSDDTTINRINFQGGYSIWDETEHKSHNGVEVAAVMNMENCTIRNFWGSGLVISADVEHGVNTNASHGIYTSIKSIENREHGIYIQGGDSNQCNFYRIDIRDNKGTGIWDNSFLGCQFFGCMAHHNGRNYAATDGNNRATFFGCYSEGGRVPDHLAGISTWVGAINSSGFDLYESAAVISGRAISSAVFGDITLDHEGMKFNRLNVTHGITLKPTGEGYPHFALDHLERIYEFFGATQDFPASYKDRRVSFAAMGVNRLFIGSRLYCEGMPEDFKGFEFKPGDTLLNPDYDGTNIKERVFTKNGWTDKY